MIRLCKQVIKMLGIAFLLLSICSQKAFAGTQCKPAEAGWGTMVLEGYNDLVNLLSGRTGAIESMAYLLDNAKVDYVAAQRRLNELRSLPSGMSSEERVIEMYLVKQKIEEAQKNIVKLSRSLAQANKELGWSTTKNIVSPIVYFAFFGESGWRRAIMGVTQKGLADPEVIRDWTEVLIGMALGQKRSPWIYRAVDKKIRGDKSKSPEAGKLRPPVVVKK